MIINTFQEWERIGYYWSWANGNGKIFRREFGYGSPMINELMIESGYAFSTKEEVIEWIERIGKKRIDIPPCEYLYFQDFDKIKNYSDLAEVYQYLDNKGHEIIEDIFLSPKHYLLRKDISIETLLNFDVKKRKSFWGRLWEGMINEKDKFLGFANMLIFWTL